VGLAEEIALTFALDDVRDALVPAGWVGRAQQGLPARDGHGLIGRAVTRRAWMLAWEGVEVERQARAATVHRGASAP
jgi:hypothetical protein